MTLTHISTLLALSPSTPVLIRHSVGADGQDAWEVHRLADLAQVSKDKRQGAHNKRRIAQ